MKSERVGIEEMGQLTGKDAGSEVEMQKTLVLWKVLHKYKGPRIMLSLDINGEKDRQREKREFVC